MSKILRSSETYAQRPWIQQPMTPAITEADMSDTRNTILEAARSEVVEMLETAERECDLIRQQAYLEGFEQGKVAGEEAYTAHLAEVRGVIAEVEQQREAYLKQAEPELVKLAIAIAEKIVGEELAINPARIVNITREQMNRIRDREALRVRLHPDLLPFVDQERDSLFHAVEGLCELNLIDDSRIEHGGVVIETDNGSVDARLSSQFTVVRRALSEHLEGVREPSLL